MKMVGLDFETRSKTDIKSGVYKYASCPTTDILCLSVIDKDSGREWLWYPADGGFPLDMCIAIAEADLIVAHNAEFDRAIWEFIATNDYYAPTIPNEKWYCSSAQCRVNAIPAGLEKAARALKIKVRKDHRGKALIKLLSIPNKEGNFNEDAKALIEMGAYCLQDTRLMLQVVNLTRMMSATEHLDWQITCDINERGAKVDVELAALAVTYAGDERDEIAELLTKITNGALTKHTQSVRARNWVLDQCKQNSDIVNLMTIYKNGEKKLTFDKGTRANLLELAASGEIELSDEILTVIELFDQGNKASVAKFQKMLDMAEDDDRVRGAFVFAGASQTQRFASRGLQLHNMRRDCWSAEATEDLKDDMVNDFEIPDVMNTLSKLLRPTIIPEEGKVFVVGDWSAIEGRVLPWLAEDPRTEAVFGVFMANDADKTQLDIYEHTAASMRIDDRQIGKVATLALGYQGSVGAFMAMAKNYGLSLPEAQVKGVVQKWRAANPWATDFWKKCERAALKAMRNAGTYVKIGRCQFVLVEGLIGDTLCGILPCGTIIQYPDARIDYVDTPYGSKHQVSYAKASLTPKADATEWPRHSLYGGLIAENFTQGAAGSILKHSLRELSIRDAPVVLHVHDEIVLEIREAAAQWAAADLQSIMENPPEWANGLPLKAEPVIMKRYGK
jgi:DNA polymerase